MSIIDVIAFHFSFQTGVYQHMTVYRNKELRLCCVGNFDDVVCIYLFPFRDVLTYHLYLMLEKIG